MTDKIDWSQVPEWVQFVATDANGRRRYFETQPLPDDMHGVWLVQSARKSVTDENACPHWRDTLVERPKPVKRERWGWMYGTGDISGCSYPTEEVCMKVMSMHKGHPVLISWEE